MPEEQAKCEMCLTCDGASVPVGTVLYNYEGVSRENWIKHHGEWWVAHYWLHFMHWNPVSRLYSTVEAASRDWRHRLTAPASET